MTFLITRFQREAKTMATLDHPNLGRILDFWNLQNQPYYGHRVRGRKTAPQANFESSDEHREEIVEIFSQILDGHSHNTSKAFALGHKAKQYRDRRTAPQAVKQRVYQTKTAILLDFGIAKKFDPTDDTGADNFKTQGLTARLRKWSAARFI